MFCPNCGTVLPDEAKFCSSCGKAITIKAVLRQESPQQTAPQQKIPQQTAPQQKIPQQTTSQQKIPQQTTSQQTTYQQPIQVQVPEKKSGKKWIPILLGIVAVVACICVAVFIINGKHNEKGKGNTPSNSSSQGNTEKNNQQEENAQTSQDSKTDNLIVNGDFSSGLIGWDIFLQDGNGTISYTDDGKMKVQVTNCGNVDWDVQVYYDGFALDMGAKYELAFDVYSDSNITFVAKIQENGGNYNSFFTNRISVSNGGGHVSIPFTVEISSSYAPRLALNVGNMQEYGDTSPAGGYSFTFDNFELRRISE